MAAPPRSSVLVLLGVLAFAPSPTCAWIINAAHKSPTSPIASRNAATITMQSDEKANPMELVKQAGLAGVVSYFCVEVSFFAIALPIGYFVWHESTGEWLRPLLLLQDSSNEDKARLVGLILSYIVILKTLFPLRLGATLLLTPKMRELFDRIGVAEP